MVSICKPVVHAQTLGDEAAICSLVDDLSVAWDHGDASAMARHFQPDGTFTNIFGIVYYGRPAFEERHHFVLSTMFSGTKSSMTIRRLHFMRPDVALVDINCEISSIKENVPELYISGGVLNTRLLLVLAKDTDEWSIAAFHNVNVKQPATQ